MKKTLIPLSALAILLTSTPLSIACKTDDVKTKLDKSEKITADMIINWKNEYDYTNDKNETKTIKANELKKHR